MSKIINYIQKNGLGWTILFALRAACMRFDACLRGRVIPWLDSSLVAQECRTFIIGPESVSSKAFTKEYNQEFYNRYDWSDSGEEWTRDVDGYMGKDPETWKKNLIDGMLIPNIPEGCTVLEIGPGGGRWTEVLLGRCGHVHVADVSEVCLDLCRKRFSEKTNITYHHITRGTLEFLPDASLDRVWSYDVFVHINPNETSQYLKEFARVLKPGGIGVIHHAGVYDKAHMKKMLAAGRAPMTRDFFAHLVVDAGLSLVGQNSTLIHFPHDVITVFRK